MAASVTVSVMGRSYEIACDPGQEERVRRLAGDIDKRATDLLKRVGAVGEGRLLFMVALLFADELADVRAALERERDGAAPADSELAGGIAGLAARLDAIAERLESA